MQKAVLGFVLLLGLGLIGLALLLDPTPKAETRPNVVLILIDTLRADRIHAERNGKAVMPNLAELAKEGATFEHALAACSWTRPSMATLFTGAYVDTHQVYYSVEEDDPEHPTSDLLPENWPTLPEWFADNGYDNLAFVTNANLTYPLGFGQGFAPGRYFFANGARAEEVTDRTLKEMSGVKAPFFLYLHYMDPHVPYNPPEKTLDMFGALPELTAEDATIFENFMDYYMECIYMSLGIQTERKMPDLSPQGKERVWTLYDLECHYADAQIGLLVKTLRAQHPDTLFIITADHGEEFWEHGGMGHGTTLYEEQIQVPLIVLGPGIKPQLMRRTTELIGLCPTLAAYLKLPRLETWQGRDWFGPMLDATTPAYARTRGPWERLGVDAEAVWESKLKVIRNNAKAKNEAYDLQADPAEKNNITETRHELAQVGLKRLDAHKAMNVNKRGMDKVRVQETIDPVLRKQLDDLGYFEDEEGKKKTIENTESKK